MVCYVYLILMMHGNFKILVIVFYLCHLSLVKQRLRYHCIHNWNGRLEESRIAIFYKHFSTLFRYIKPFESGRWSKPNPPPLSERHCLFCNLLEDEYHLVLECYLYSTLRKLYIPKYYRNRLNMLKMYVLINAGNSKILKQP